MEEERDEWLDKAQRYYDAMGDAGAQSLGACAASGIGASVAQWSPQEREMLAQYQRNIMNACAHGVHVHSCPVCCPVRL